MFLRGNTSPEKLEANIQNDFGWNRHAMADGQAVILYPDTAIRLLSQAGVDQVISDPGNTSELNSIRSAEIGRTSFSALYELEGGGVVAEKHYPDTYQGGKASRRGMFKVPPELILNHVYSSLALQEKIKQDGLGKKLQGESPEYTTPQLLGHLVFFSGSNRARHYTLRTKLNELVLPKHPRGDSDHTIRDAIVTRKDIAIETIDYLARTAGLTRHNIDLSQVLDDEGRLVFGLTTKPAYSMRKCQKLGGDPHWVISRATQDYEAPWLNTKAKPTKSRTSEAG
jgi:hypothetical protein